MIGGHCDGCGCAVGVWECDHSGEQSRRKQLTLYSCCVNGLHGQQKSCRIIAQYGGNLEMYAMTQITRWSVAANRSVGLSGQCFDVFEFWDNLAEIGILSTKYGSDSGDKYTMS